MQQSRWEILWLTHLRGEHPDTLLVIDVQCKHLLTFDKVWASIHDWLEWALAPDINCVDMMWGHIWEEVWGTGRKADVPHAVQERD